MKAVSWILLGLFLTLEAVGLTVRLTGTRDAADSWLIASGLVGLVALGVDWLQHRRNESDQP